MGDRKFDSIAGLELEIEEEEKDTQDIEYGNLVLKLRGEEEPLLFNILTEDPKVKAFLAEFFVEFVNSYVEEIKETNAKKEEN